MSAYRPNRSVIGHLDVEAHNKRWMNRKPQLCWRCQKDKPTYGGSITMLGGAVQGAVRRFICLDCLNEKQAKKMQGAC